MRKALITVVLGALTVALSPTPASAHADLKASTPRNGAVIATAPATVSLVFSEPVEVESVAVLNAKVQPLASSYTTQGAIVTITPRAPLADGASSVQWKARSDDGHEVTGAIAFIVGKPAPVGKPTTIITVPKIPTVLSGSTSGPLTVAFTSKASSGEVQWSNPAYAGPFTWRVTGNGKLAKGTGILPSPGKWTMQANLVGKGGLVVLTEGTVTLA